MEVAEATLECGHAEGKKWDFGKTQELEEIAHSGI